MTVQQVVQGLLLGVVARGAILITGQDGAGHTGWASRLPALLPWSDEQQAHAEIRYAAAGIARVTVAEPPFRAPHHTCSALGLLGNDTRSGEIALASGGVLYLDALGEWPLQSLIAVKTSLSSCALASRPLLVASAGLCPCGAQSRMSDPCPHCELMKVAAYQDAIEHRFCLLGGGVVVEIPRQQYGWALAWPSDSPSWRDTIHTAGRLVANVGRADHVVHQLARAAAALRGVSPTRWTPEDIDTVSPYVLLPYEDGGARHATL